MYSIGEFAKQIGKRVNKNKKLIKELISDDII